MKRLRTWLQHDEGFSLVEALVAIMLAALASAGVASALGTVNREGSRSRSTGVSTSIARAELEKVRVRGYPLLSHTADSLAGDAAVEGGNFDPDGSGPLPTEAIVYASTGIATPMTTTAQGNITYTVRRYVTSAGTGVRRLTVTVAWTEMGQPRTSSLSSLVASTAQPIVASSNALNSSGAGSVGLTASAKATRGGGYDSQTAGSTTPVSGWTVNSAAALASATPAVNHHAEATIGSATTSLTGLTISMTNVTVIADALAGQPITTSSSGSVTINGVTYNNPAPGTTLTVGPWTISIGASQNDASGAKSISFINVSGTGGQDYRWAWAWVAPVTPW